MKTTAFATILALLIVYFQYRVWGEDGGLAEIRAHQRKLELLKQEAEQKRQRNDKLYAEIKDLHKGQEALEERARNELGMIKPDETFFQVLE